MRGREKTHYGNLSHRQPSDVPSSSPIFHSAQYYTPNSSTSPNPAHSPQPRPSISTYEPISSVSPDAPSLGLSLFVSDDRLLDLFGFGRLIGSVIVFSLLEFIRSVHGFGNWVGLVHPICHTKSEGGRWKYG